MSIKSSILDFDKAEVLWIIKKNFKKKGRETAMDMSTVDTVRDELLKQNQTFRDLVQQHQDYEKRLNELAGLTYPNDEELLEESTLKKKKLSIKDEIYAMMSEYSKTH